MTLLALLFAVWPADLDSYIEKARVDWDVPGIAITVVRDGQVVVTKGYGVRRLGSPERVDEHTVFDIASLSKSFTAAAVATLVDEGKMRWDDPVRRHLPAFELADPYRSQNVTMRDLLAHRLGLEQGNFVFRFGNYSTPELIQRMRLLHERAPFRTNLTYSNLGYMVAGEAAAAAAGLTFPELLRTRLVEPLGMRETSIAVNHDVAANHADGHAIIAGVQQPIRAKKAMNILPANALNSTAHDMARWLLFQLGDGTWEGKRLISAAAMTEMHEPQNIIATTPQMRKARGVQLFGAYALGWQVMDFRGRKMLWHSGGADGMPVYMAILPEEKIGVAVMINTWAAGTLHGAVAARILDQLLGIKDPRDWAGEALEGQRSAPEPEERPRIAGTRASRPIDAYAGTYVDEPHGDMVLTAVDGRLTLQFAGGEIADLEHWHHDVFRVRWRDRAYEFADTFLAFTLDADANPRSFEMQLGRDVIKAERR